MIRSKPIRLNPRRISKAAQRNGLGIATPMVSDHGIEKRLRCQKNKTAGSLFVRNNPKLTLRPQYPADLPGGHVHEEPSLVSNLSDGFCFRCGQPQSAASLIKCPFRSDRRTPFPMISPIGRFGKLLSVVPRTPRLTTLQRFVVKLLSGHT